MEGFSFRFAQESPLWRKWAFCAGCIALAVFFGRSVRAADTAAQQQTLQSQIDALEKEVAGIDANLQQIKTQTESLSREVAIFDNQIKKSQLEIKRITLAIQQANIDIVAKSASIDVVTKSVENDREVLAKNLRQLDRYDQESLAAILIKNASISDFFRTVDSVKTLQASTENLLQELRQQKTDLEAQKADLEDFLGQQQALSALQKIAEQNLEAQRQEKNQLLAETKGKESVFQTLLNSKKKDLTALKTQLFYLEKTGVTAEDAVKFAELAADRTGINAAFLLALLEVETGKQFEDGVITAGTNLGTGNWKADMNPNQYGAFLQITSALNLDPNAMPVSARPCAKKTRERIGPGVPCGYGWGGAMGPAQFIPTTWLLFADRVASLIGHTPANPWSVEDSFTAAAVFLADAGASSKTAAGEIAAAKTYLSGKPSCRTNACISYARTILTLKDEIAQNI